MTKEELLAQVLTTPNNSNRQVLETQFNELLKGSSSSKLLYCYVIDNEPHLYYDKNGEQEFTDYLTLMPSDVICYQQTNTEKNIIATLFYHYSLLQQKEDTYLITYCSFCDANMVYLVDNSKNSPLIGMSILKIMITLSNNQTDLSLTDFEVPFAKQYQLS